MSLKKQAIGGVKWTTVGAITSSVFQLLQIIVLSRFLHKKDFGLMAMAIFVIGISQIFIDMGISNSIIHKQKINKFQLSTLFWLNIFIGIAVFCSLLFTSPLIASFYKEPELKGVLNWTGITFLILPWGQQFEAILIKSLQFKSLIIRDVIGKLLGFIASVVFAYYQFGVYALVYANIINACISTMLLILFGLQSYKPRFIISFRSLNGKGFFAFGFYQMGEKLLNYFNSQFDTLLIGKMLGMDALGIYNVAKTLAFKPYQIINPIITKVAFPVLAQLQTEVVRLKKAYLEIINVLSLVNAPLYAIIIVLAKPLIILVFGTSWIKAVPFLQILSVTALCNSIGNPIGALQLAKGRADWGFYWNLGMFLFMPISIWIGSSYGLLGVAWSVAIFKILVIIPAWRFFVYPLSNASFIEYSKSFSEPILFSFISGLISYLIIINLKETYLSLIIGTCIIGLTFLFLNYVFNKRVVTSIFLKVELSFH